jgi:hypothetical protein
MAIYTGIAVFLVCCCVRNTVTETLYVPHCLFYLFSSFLLSYSPISFGRMLCVWRRTDQRRMEEEEEQDPLFFVCLLCLLTSRVESTRRGNREMCISRERERYGERSKEIERDLLCRDVFVGRDRKGIAWISPRQLNTTDSEILRTVRDPPAVDQHSAFG